MHIRMEQIEKIRNLIQMHCCNVIMKFYVIIIGIVLCYFNNLLKFKTIPDATASKHCACLALDGGKDIRLSCKSQVSRALNYKNGT